MGTLNSYAFVIIFTIIFMFILENFLPKKYVSSEVKGNATLLPAIFLALLVYLLINVFFN